MSYIMLSSFDFDLVIHVTIFMMSIVFYLSCSWFYCFYFYCWRRL